MPEMNSTESLDKPNEVLPRRHMDESQRRPRRYTVKQAAKRMGFSESYVRDLIENGEIGYIRRQTKAGSSIRLRERDIEQWEKENSVCPDINKNDRTTDLPESQGATSGTSPGRREDALAEFRRERRMKRRQDEASPNS